MTARSVRIATASLFAALLAIVAARAQDTVSPVDTGSPIGDSAPIGTRENYFRTPYKIGSFRHMDRIFPYHIVYRAGPISELPRADRQLDEVTYKWKGAAHTLDELHQLTKTTGFLVIKDGKIVEERYFLGADEASTFTSMSVAKSFTSTLVGWALADGKIRSIDDPITDYVQELKGTGYDGVTIKAILQMSSGVKFTERYIPGHYSDMDLMFERGMIDESIPLNDYLKGLARVLPPGAKFAYKGSDTQALGWLVRRVTGESLCRLSFGQGVAADGHGARRVLEYRSARARRDGDRVHLPQRDAARLRTLRPHVPESRQMERQADRSRRLGRSRDHARWSAGAAR